MVFRHSPLLFGLVILALAAGALAVRLPRLELRPMHGDEANQAVRTGILLETGQYRYDPHEFHGPTLYYATLPALWLSGAPDFAATTEWEYRVVPVVFGAGLIVLLLLVGDGLGRGPAVLAAVLTAVSPAMVFYSRYYIQETLLVFFTLAAIACAWRLVRSGSKAWAAGAGASLGLAHSTKETWVLAAAAMGIALVLTLAWNTWRGKAAAKGESAAEGGLAASGKLAACPTWAHVLVGLASACAVAVALYSSFGTHWRGPIDSILAYGAYWRRGTEAGIHSHPWHFYLGLLLANRPARGLFWTEGLIVGLAGVGFLWSLLRRESSVASTSSHSPAGSFCRFLAFYTLALTAIYSAISYKTPWCMLSFLQGMILLAGVGAWAILRRLPGIPAKAVVLLLLAAGVAHLGRQCYWLNFRLCADQRNPYVYAHTSTDVLNLASQMERLAQVSPERHDMVIHVVAPENYWPLPWYLRQFNPDRVGYWQDATAWANDAGRGPPPSVILLTQDVRPAIDARLPDAYNQQMLYGLRPGVFVSVYVRATLWREFLAAAAGRST